MSETEQQLTRLRQQIIEIKAAKKWLEQYMIDAHPSVRGALAAYNKWLSNKQNRITQLGKTLKAQMEQGQ